MRMFDIIKHKRDGEELTPEEINYFVAGYAKGAIPDYQAAALAMAIFYQGMSARETANLTMQMAHSGDMVDLSSIPGVKVDKHSTGGVGDKTTLVIVPIVASLGVPVAKMSGRGLGHTGGTIDKLESIPGLSVDVEMDDFIETVKKVGAAVVGQTAELVPADKRFYALRDVTATIDSVPLIAASVMSKKIAAGADKILLDVKFGSGAFMKDDINALQLALSMVSIGEEVGRTTVALVSNMDQPLGRQIGNALEVMEAIEVLRGKASEDITETCLVLAANMLSLAGKGDVDSCRALAQEQIDNGAALAKFREMVEALGGDSRVVDDFSLFAQPSVSHEVCALQDGYIYAMDAEQIGMAAALLGAGRRKIGEAIDPAAGITLAAKVGDYVHRGDVIATLHTSDKRLVYDAERTYLNALDIRDEQPNTRPTFIARVDAKGVEQLA